MNERQLLVANELKVRIDLLADWLDRPRPLHYGPTDGIGGGNMLSEDAQQRIRAIAKADVETQLSQLRQEFEAL